MRKAVCLILCFAVLMSAVPFAYAAESGFNRNLSLDEINFLEGVGILEKADVFSSNTDFTVTKGEAARLLIRMSGYTEDNIASSDSVSPYKDVKGTTNYRNEIIAATSLGFFGKEKLLYFYPDDTAETMWFARAVARALGYRLQLDAKGDGLCSQLGLLDGAVSSKSRYLRRDGALKILCNAADVSIIKETGSFSGGIVTTETKNKTILTEYFDIYKRDGVFLADSSEAIFGERTDEGKVNIGDDTYYISETINTDGLLGKKVRIYYKEVDGVKTLVYIKLLENKVVEISADNAEYSYENHCYYVYNNRRKVKMSMKSETLVSYNGEAYFDKSHMKPKTGSITLIDNDSDGKYDVCIIKEFTNVIVSSIDVNQDTIYDKLDSSRNLKLSDFDKFVIYDENRKETELSDLKSDIVLTVYKNVDGTRGEAYISKKTASMYVQKINSSDKAVFADDEEYKLSGDLRFDAEIITAGQNYFFYLNYWNEIVYVTEDNNYTAFYLVTVKSGKGLEPGIFVKGLEENGFVTSYELADKVRIYTYSNGRQTMKKEDVYSLLAPAGVTNRQLVKIFKGADEKIKEIVLAYEAENHSDFVGMTKEFPLIHAAYYGDPAKWPSEAIYNTANKSARVYNPNTFGNWLTYTSKTIEMNVPTNNTTSTWDYEDLRVNSVRFGSSSVELNITPENFNVYFSGKDRVAVDYMVKDIGNSTEVNWRKDGYFLAPYLVKSIETVMNDDGTLAVRLETMSRYGVQGVYYTTDGSSLAFDNLLNTDVCTFPSGKTAIEAGDIIAFEITVDKKIKTARLVYDGVGMQDVYVGAKFPSSTSDCLTGEVLRSRDGIVEYKVLEGFGNDVSAGKIYNADVNKILLEYDKQNETVRTLKNEEINPGDRIVLYYRYGAIYMAVIYK